MVGDSMGYFGRAALGGYSFRQDLTVDELINAYSGSGGAGGHIASLYIIRAARNENFPRGGEIHVRKLAAREANRHEDGFGGSCDGDPGYLR